MWERIENSTFEHWIVDLLDEDDAARCQSLATSLTRSPLVPTRYLYGSDRANDLWEQTLRSLHYGFGAQSQKVFLRNVDFIAELATRESPTGLTLASLGSGRGTKDVLLIEAIQKRLRDQQKIDYYPIDASTRMLGLVHQTLKRAKFRPLQLRVMSAVGDVANSHHVDRILTSCQRPTLFMALGNVIGNNSEAEILSTLLGAMKPGDRALIEVSIAVQPERHDSRFSLDINGLEFDGLPQGSSALDLLGIPFDQSRTEHRIVSNRSVVPHTRTACSMYRIQGTTQSRKEYLQLSSVHLYDPAALIDYLESHGLRRLFYAFSEASALMMFGMSDSGTS